VLFGGLLADFYKRHDLTAAAAFLISAALLALLVWTPLPSLPLMIVMIVSGLMQGAVRPARDMMVRAVVPPGAMGKAFGVVSSGQAIGGAIAPVLFGWMVDLGRPDWVFYLMIVFTLLCVAASFAPKALRTVAVE
jgi:MFS family permease